MALPVFIAATVLNVGLQQKQNKEVKKAQDEKNDIERAQQGEQASRARRKTIKESLVKKAQIENIAGSTGQQGSSAVIAGTQQVQSSASNAIGQINTALGFNNANSAASQNILNAQRVSPLQQTAGAVAQGAALFKS